MTTLSEAIAAANAADLLPDRTQARAADLTGSLELIDSLDAGEGAYLALVRAGDRILVIPGQLDATGFHRSAVSARILNTESTDNFRIELIDPIIKSHLAHQNSNTSEQSITVDQSNDSVIVNEHIMLKWQINATPSPAPSRLRTLASQTANTPITPAPLAIVEWTDPETDEALTLATATEFVPDSQDGWDWAVELVRAFAQGRNVDAITPFALIGQLTGQMHAAFAQSHPQVESIELLGKDAITQFAVSAHEDLDIACSLMDGEEGERLLQRRDMISEHLGDLNTVESTFAIDTHGDFHVGQILKSPTDQYYIVDFDGSPVLTPLERLKRQPAARDIAGMLASIDHVARVVNYRTEGLEPHAALIWSAHAQEAFLVAYKDVLRQHGLLKILDERLLKPFMLHQELREYIYSVRHLPHWRYVPDSVITSMFPAKDLDEGVI